MRAWPARSTHTQTVINRIMLRFRPIAPKPVGDEAVSSAAEQNKTDLTGRRVKRKYVRVRGRQSKRRPNRGKLQSSPPAKSGVEDAPPPEEGAVTLQLLGGRSESEGRICDISVPKSEENWKAGVDGGMKTAGFGGGPADLKGGGSVIETWVVMECVTDKFTGVGLGFSDKEKIYNLERDTCPGFVSDWTNNVIWVNQAYKKMVAEDEGAAAEKGFLVWLVVKEQLPHLYPSFACRVRVTQQKVQGEKCNKIVPCDVWRMEFAGFAWKLDVNTALTLGF